MDHSKSTKPETLEDVSKRAINTHNELARFLRKIEGLFENMEERLSAVERSTREQT